jgi:hypothetical protein
VRARGAGPGGLLLRLALERVGAAPEFDRRGRDDGPGHAQRLDTPGGGDREPFSGKLITVWNLPDDPAELAAWVVDLGCAGVEIKTADGGSSWVGAPGRNVTPDYVARLRQLGVGLVLGWSYNYCDLRTGPDALTRTPAARFGRSLAALRDARSWDRGDGVPEEEAAAAAEGVRVLGLDGHTFDLEIECEGHGDLVAVMLAEARELMPGVAFAAHTWAQRSGHERYPWDEIAAGVGCVRPMQYRPVWDATVMWSEGELGPWLAGQVVAPVLGITESADTPSNLDADADVHARHGAVGFSLWEAATLPGLPGVAEWYADLETGEAPAPGVDLGALQQRTWDLLDELQALAAEWESIGYASTSVGISSSAESAKSHVRATKGEM